MLRGLLSAVIFTLILACAANVAIAQNTHPCSDESSLRSLQGNTFITETFVNSSSSAINIFWLNYQGVETHYFTVQPGGSVVNFGTYLTHPWIVWDISHSKCFGIWIFTANGEVATVTNTPIGGGGGGGGGGSVLEPSISSINFTGFAGGAAPAPQSFTLSSSGKPSQFAIATDSGQTGSLSPPWISVSPAGGSTPALIVVTVNPGELVVSNYNARIVITVPNDSSQQPVYVAVSFVVTSSPPKLDVSPRSLSFRGTTGVSDKVTQTIVVQNIGGGGPDFFKVSIPQSVPGLKVSPMSGVASPGIPVAIEVSIDARAAAPMGYKGTIRFKSADATIDVAISLFVAKPGAIMSVDQTGMYFNYRQAQGLQLPQVLHIYDQGDANSSVSFTAEIANGAPWLTLTPTSGIAVPGKPATITATINTNASQLAPKGYFALVRLTDKKADNPTQYVAVVLNVTAASAPPEPDPQPRGLVFIVKPGQATPSQPINVYTSSQAHVNFTASATGSGAVTVTPSSGSITTSTPATLTINAGVGLPPGVYQSSVNIEEGSIDRSVDVTVIVVHPSGSADFRDAAQSSSCTPSRVVVTETGLPNGFSVPGGFPATLAAVMNDDCGNTITDGAVVATFSNGDPALSLSNDLTGMYSGTWQPATHSLQTTVTMTGTSGTLTSGSAQITGAVAANPTPTPVLTPGGTANIFFHAGALSPGAVTLVNGTGLATKAGTAKTIPLPTSFDGTTMLVGANLAPLFSINTQQVEAQIPWELEPGQYSVIASVNGALSLPDTITINQVQPAVKATADGHALALHANGKMVSSASPAVAGETVTIFLVGMGVTHPAVVSGHAAPAKPEAQVVAKPVVTVHGENAKVSFAGLTPGSVGLYQVNFTVPPGLPNGDVNLVVSQDGVPGNTTKLTVKK
jgi:uncharacterized protein (TIGR03437 family)